MKKILLLSAPLFLFVFPVFSQEESKQDDLSDYGKKLSIGISILDGFGIPVRYYAKNHVMEAGAYVAGVAVYENNNLIDYRTWPMFGAGYTYFGDRFLKEKRKRDKIRAHGIAVRVNQLVGSYPTTIPSLSWAMETFREGRKNRSFLFELGIQYALPNFTYNNEPVPNAVGLRLRCQWNFFLK
ncbi:MAG: hypothetical protein JNJ57_17110 [Saprospiraceae bacterium]|nr:hypothetical protein [Saprospiraceae bacterium]